MDQWDENEDETMKLEVCFGSIGRNVGRVADAPD